MINQFLLQTSHWDKVETSFIKKTSLVSVCQLMPDNSRLLQVQR